MTMSKLSTLFLAVVSASLLCLWGIECRTLGRSSEETYEAISCRKHTVSITDFRGVGDGKTSNTKAFALAVAQLSKMVADGGTQLIVPAGKWLTRSFNLTSNFTLYLEKDAVILAWQGRIFWTNQSGLKSVFASYGRGRDAPGWRYSSLIFSTNLTDVVIIGNNGSLDGQGQPWWVKFRSKKLDLTRAYLIEIMSSENIQISNPVLLDSHSWFVDQGSNRLPKY